ncbi:hypothetical protein ElyMa_001652900 [Elysia marginata]|uniref:Small EDRK-rich factor-like N-terminal domain-containing protein n=1 Tax=Elysia marginata TaxID=1093978 RepID=A0AAV4JR48_9GAST|nr:hypothetical protein ElyMa_001652900 [Elysia marginata]
MGTGASKKSARKAQREMVKAVVAHGNELRKQYPVQQMKHMAVPGVPQHQAQFQPPPPAVQTQPVRFKKL